TASSPADYSFSTQGVTFNGGAASGATQSVNITTVNDALLEGSETVNLSLALTGTSGTATTPGNTSNTTTITDDETATLAIATTSTAAEATSGNQAVGTVTLLITGTQTGSDPFALGAGISLTANVSDAGGGTASSPADYSFSTQGVTFNGGAASGATRSVNITTVNDAL